MSRFLKLPLRAEDKRSPNQDITSRTEARYWSKYANLTTSKQPGFVSDLVFSPVAPYELAVCSSTRVQIYDSNFCTMNKSFNRFKSSVTCAAFRPDGLMLATGSDDNAISVFEVASKTRLRFMTDKHRAAVRCVSFIDEGTRLLSCSDDKTALGIDIPTETTRFKLSGHTDFVRTGFESAANKSVMVTGSYDHTIKLWDSRAAYLDPNAAASGSSAHMSAASSACVMTMDHGAPVTALLSDMTGNILISAGDNRIRVWDVMGGGALLHEVQAHQKAITSLALDSTGLRLLSGSADQHVNVYDTRNGYNMVHSMAFNSPVMSVAFAPNASTLAVGLADGTLTMRRRPNDDLSGHIPVMSKNLGYHDRMRKGVRYTVGTDDFVVRRPDIRKLNAYESYLRKFQYAFALDAAISKRDKQAVIAILEEFLIKGVTLQGLGNRDEATLVPILKFVLRHITNPHCTNTLIDITMILIEMYTPILGQFNSIDQLFVKLNERLLQELSFQSDCHRLQGQIDLLLTSAVPGDANEESKMYEWDDNDDDEDGEEGDEDEEDDHHREANVESFDSVSSYENNSANAINIGTPSYEIE